MTFLDANYNDDFRDRLLPGERIIWTGKPVGGLLFMSRDMFLIPFSLMWGGFAIFGEVGVFKTNAPASFDLWGVPFVLAGLYLIVGRFFADAWIRSKIRYALTDQRILILRRGFGIKFTALPLVRLPNIDLDERSSGRGTIRFGESVSLWTNRNGFGMWMPSSDPTPQFLNIENVRQVFDRIQSLIASNRTAS